MIGDSCRNSRENNRAISFPRLNCLRNDNLRLSKIVKPKILIVGTICIRHQMTMKGKAIRASNPTKMNLGFTTPNKKMEKHAKPLKIIAQNQAQVEK